MERFPKSRERLLLRRLGRKKTVRRACSDILLKAQLPQLPLTDPFEGRAEPLNDRQQQQLRAELAEAGREAAHC